MNFYPINEWPAESAKVFKDDDADGGGHGAFLPAVEQPAWATRYETDTGGFAANLTVASEPTPVDMQFDDQLPGEAHLERRSSVDWQPGCLELFTFSIDVVVANASDGTEIVRLSVPGARALAAVLVQLADTADAGQAVGR